MHCCKAAQSCCMWQCLQSYHLSPWWWIPLQTSPPWNQWMRSTTLVPNLPKPTMLTMPTRLVQYLQNQFPFALLSSLLQLLPQANSLVPSRAAVAKWWWTFWMMTWQPMCTLGGQFIACHVIIVYGHPHFHLPSSKWNTKPSHIPEIHQFGWIKRMPSILLHYCHGWQIVPCPLSCHCTRIVSIAPLDLTNKNNHNKISSTGGWGPQCWYNNPAPTEPPPVSSMQIKCTQCLIPLHPSKLSSSNASSQRPKLPHGLTVFELKEMTKAWLQAKALEKHENNSPESLGPIPTIVHVSPEYRDWHARSLIISSPAPSYCRSPYPDHMQPTLYNTSSHNSWNDYQSTREWQSSAAEQTICCWTNKTQWVVQ